MNTLCESHPWLEPGKPSARQVASRLFCLPPAGGSSAFFRPWLAATQPGVEVCAVRLPGREQRANEPPTDRIAPLVRELADGLHAEWETPFAFFGHSLGALIAFELARELRRRKLRQPEALFVSAAPAPQLPPRPPRYQLPQDLFVRELRELGGTPEVILSDRGLLNHFMPVLRGDFAMVDTYEYIEEAPLDLPVMGFGGTADDEVSPKALAQWQTVTRRFTMQLYPGDHFFLTDHWSSMLRAIATVLGCAAL